ncbi:glutathione hydrolase 1 proenzyme-like isoform X2 [Tachysurus fulvidraco]|uniref:glutathione hydrolase 1 proenzyme-like isoform X2 n=1 Tax=Tachysurus fulvidraco TaxID=1234273 RepID=UPI001FEDFE72|nr:glutathione hydrolase 1 proenzyme-like isoform X2 [Tachysurus fulvidraco]
MQEQDVGGRDAERQHLQNQQDPSQRVKRKWRSKILMCIIISLVIIIIIALLGAIVGITDRIRLIMEGYTSNHCYSNSGVAAEAGKCSEIGRNMLKRGGSAVDAAIAVLLCVGLFNAQSMGIGGGHYIIIYDSITEKVETINAKEMAPLKATVNMFGKNTKLAREGGLAIAVPGELRGYELAHRRHGHLPWRDLFQPSIKLARAGVRVSRVLAKSLSENQTVIEDDPVLCEVFCDSNKTILRENDTVRFPQLADTYERIANEGADVFYNGAMAETIVKDIQAAGGIITLEDLSGYKPVLNESPLKINVGEYTMHVPNAPSSGPVLALILNIVKGYNFSASSVSTPEKKTLTYHRINEAFRFAYAMRTKLGDPQYLNITDLILNMTSDYFADHIRSKITDKTTHPETYYGPEYFNPETYGTTHVSVIAEDGSAVSVTSSINLHFGSKVMSPSTGIIFNNIMDDFSSPHITNAFNVPPSPNNFIKPGKRPLSSMCPTIICDKHNKVKMVVGASGGTRITTATAQVILNSLFFNYDLKRAVEEPRFYNQLSPNDTEVEPDFEKSLIHGLEQRNHTIKKLNDTPSAVQVVMRQDNRICAESDPRKGGKAAGY